MSGRWCSLHTRTPGHRLIQAAGPVILFGIILTSVISLSGGWALLFTRRGRSRAAMGLRPAPALRRDHGRRPRHHVAAGGRRRLVDRRAAVRAHRRRAHRPGDRLCAAGRQRCRQQASGRRIDHSARQHTAAGAPRRGAHTHRAWADATTGAGRHRVAAGTRRRRPARRSTPPAARFPRLRGPAVPARHPAAVGRARARRRARRVVRG